jgi:hypothetical protein
LLESPVPILVGINISESHAKELELVERSDNLLFVYLDQEVRLVNKPITLLKNVRTPYFEGLLGKVEQIMRDPVALRNPR